MINLTFAGYDTIFHCTKNVPADLLTFTEEILNGKLHLCAISNNYFKTEFFLHLSQIYTLTSLG